MTDSRLHDLLSDLVEEVEPGPAVPVAAQVWARVRRERRRRRVTTAAGASVLVIVVGAVALAGRVPSGPAVSGFGPSRSPSVGVPRSQIPSPDVGDPSGRPRLQFAPARRALDGLPFLQTDYAALSRVPADAPPLSGSPAARVIAAFQASDRGPVLVLGSDGRWRRVDTDLVPASDGGNLSPALTSSAISPDGQQLAFPQPDALVVVDVTTGRSQRHETAGFMESVRWLPDGQIAVGGDKGTVVWAPDGILTDVGYHARNLVSQVPGGPLIEMLDTETLVHQLDGGTTRLPLWTGDRINFDEWFAAGWLRRGRLARSGFLADTAEQVVVILDAATGRATQLLELSYGEAPDNRSIGCCATLGWLDDSTVLLRDGGQVLAWQPDSGELSRVARIPTAPVDDYSAVIAIAPKEKIDF